MTQKYRKRFVVSTMSLIAVVLITAFVIQGIIMYRDDYNVLQSTMSLMLRPLDEPNDKFKSFERDNGKPHAKPSEKDPREMISATDNDDGIAVLFYDTESGDISVLTEDYTQVPDDLESLVAAVAASDADFGRLTDHGVIFCRERAGSMYKIAVVNSGYMTRKAVANALLLSVVFVFVMALLFAVSVYLSKKAAKPMEDAMNMERQFVADISHDLKTPITVVLANNSILKSNPELPVKDQLQWIESTDESAKSMMNMVSEMLTLSSLDAPAKKTERYAVDLSAVLEKSVLQLESVAYEKNVSLEDDIKNGVTVLAIREYAERICSGLIDNAIKYEPDGGTVEVALHTAKKKAVLSVKNRGSYIPDKDLPHIFERFYRGDKSRGQTKGHGLGLPIVAGMAKRCGASVSVESDRENGTVFSVAFDIAE